MLQKWLKSLNDLIDGHKLVSTRSACSANPSYFLVYEAFCDLKRADPSFHAQLRNMSFGEAGQSLYMPYGPVLPMSFLGDAEYNHLIKFTKRDRWLYTHVPFPCFYALVCVAFVVFMILRRLRFQQLSPICKGQIHVAHFRMCSDRSADLLKFGSLFLLVLQNSVLFLSLRYTAVAHNKDDAYASTVVVFIVELIKLVSAFVLYAFENDMSPRRTISALRLQRRDAKLLAVPALCYTVQQNLIVMSRNFLSAPAIQALVQTKLLWTGFFAYVVLQKRFTFVEYASFVLLFFGVVVIEHQDSEAQPEDTQQLAVSSRGRIIGVLMCAGAAILSGFAGIFLEKMYRTQTSLWATNVYLAIVSLPLQMIAVVQYDRNNIAQNGVFHGFHSDTVLFIVVQSFGGLLVAVAIKYAGNILKNFAAALSIIATSFLSIFFFSFHPVAYFWIGVVCISIATVLHGLSHKCSQAHRKKSADSATYSLVRN